MSAAALAQLEELLRAERKAVCSLDAAFVAQAAERKEALVNELFAAPMEWKQQHKKQLETVIASLKHNGVLLAHARDILRDAIRCLAPSVASGYNAGGTYNSVARGLSVSARG